MQPEARPGVGRESARAVHAGAAAGGHVAALARLANKELTRDGAEEALTRGKEEEKRKEEKERGERIRKGKMKKFKNKNTQ